MNEQKDESDELRDHWIMQVVNDFREQIELSKPEIMVSDIIECNPISSEVQGQMIRILQEALSNIRKHANAEQVWILYRMDEQDLILEIKDNGIGFNPEDIPRISQHGLRGMRERSELIGADFQVTSKPKSGTIIRIRMPLAESLQRE
jgi:two-component system nitrate/nitrite sensor histidine kinase NarX